MDERLDLVRFTPADTGLTVRSGIAEAWRSWCCHAAPAIRRSLTGIAWPLSWTRTPVATMLIAGYR